MIEEVKQIRNKLMRRGYEAAASDPRQLESYALSLGAASEILLPKFKKELKSPKPSPHKNCHRINIGPTYLMLVGFAVENFLKGIYVISNPEIIKNDKLIKLNRHDLLQLFNELHFETTIEEKDLIERLEEFILWIGRYPIPSKFERLVPKRHRENTKFDLLIYTIPSDPIIASKILDRLQNELSKQMEAEGIFSLASHLTSRSS
jgi:hypothetical protein